MSRDLIKYAFAAGEIAPRLHGRSDIEKYDLGMAEAKNFFVDYQGGLSSRPGTEFVDFVPWGITPGGNTKLVPFRFGPDLTTSYVLLFVNLRVYFINDGSYIYEGTKVVTNAVLAVGAPGSYPTITSAAHGYANGDLVRIQDTVGTESINGRTFLVRDVTANTFDLADPSGIIPPYLSGETYVSDGTVKRAYHKVTNYTAAQLPALKVHQSRAVLYITHKDHPPRTLTRVSDINWTYADVSFGSTVPRPTGLVITPSAAGTAGVGFAVVAINKTKQKSLPSDMRFNELCVNYAATAGSVKLTWTKVTGATHYEVYRTNICEVGADVSQAQQLGFLGLAYGTQFIDNNIIPDFVVTPSIQDKPLANGAIEFVEVTAAGTGYIKTSTVTASGGPGTGFLGYPVVNAAGALIGLVTLAGGQNYTAPVTITVSTGSGGTFAVTLTPATGNYPRTNSVFQQRKIYAGPPNNPLTLYGSRPDQFDCFDVSQVIQENDAYEFELESEFVAPIEHLISTRAGLVIINEAGIWQLTGGQGPAVTPTNALAEPQSFTGCALIPPLQIDTDLLYEESKGATVRLLSYSDLTKVYSGQDLSILANHLVTPENQIVEWAWASDPFKLIHMVLEQGQMAVMCLVKEQNIYGWTPWETRGLYRNTLAITENDTDSVYYVVERLIGDVASDAGATWKRCIERQVRRRFTNVEDAWCLDCALELPLSRPVAGNVLYINATSGAGVLVTSNSAFFASGDVGKMLRAAGGKFIITAYNSTQNITVTVLIEPTDLVGTGTIDVVRPQTTWTMGAEFTVIGGLGHLEGMTVKVLADGSVFEHEVVNGKITLANPASKVIIGLPCTIWARPLPATVSDGIIQGARKRTVGFQLRVYDTKGLSAGADVNSLYAMKEDRFDQYSLASGLQRGLRDIKIVSGFATDNQPIFSSSEPLPVSILGFVQQMEVGDDSETP